MRNIAILTIFCVLFLTVPALAACPNASGSSCSGSSKAVCPSGSTCSTTAKATAATCTWKACDKTVTKNGCTASFKYCLQNGKYQFRNTSKGQTVGCYWSIYKQVCTSGKCSWKLVGYTKSCGGFNSALSKGNYLIVLSVKCKSCSCWVGPAEARITV